MCLKGSLSESRLPCAGEPDVEAIWCPNVWFSVFPCWLEPVLKGAVSALCWCDPCSSITALSKGAVKASRWVRVTASENEGIIGLRRVSKSQFDSCVCAIH